MVKSDQKGVGESLTVAISEELLRDKIYTIRGQRVMLDADLAEIYGYTTSAFNQQVARNIERFEGEDFMFRLNQDDIEGLSISQNVISMQAKGVHGGRAKMPYAFTEQGIYMLMTVLRGELAVKQSRILIRLFKTMKDYIVENQAMLVYRDNLEIAKEVMKNTRSIAEVNSRIEKLDSEVEVLDRKMREMGDKLSEVVKRSEISPILLDFNQFTEQREFVLMDGELMKASELYMRIYADVKKSVFVIDNYISIKILRHLQNVKAGVEVMVFSDNIGGHLHKVDYMDFKRERSDLDIRFVRTEGLIHDRFIVVDYGTQDEVIYHSGASEKDAGKKLMMISKFEDEIVKTAMAKVVERLMGNGELRLK